MRVLPLLQRRWMNAESIRTHCGGVDHTRATICALLFVWPWPHSAGMIKH
jgi:hypothetical protein